jgi:hypothetical protein
MSVIHNMSFIYTADICANRYTAGFLDGIYVCLLLGMGVCVYTLLSGINKKEETPSVVINVYTNKEEDCDCDCDCDEEEEEEEEEEEQEEEEEEEQEQEQEEEQEPVQNPVQEPVQNSVQNSVQENIQNANNMQEAPAENPAIQEDTQPQKEIL